MKPTTESYWRGSRAVKGGGLKILCVKLRRFESCPRHQHFSNRMGSVSTDPLQALQLANTWAMGIRVNPWRSIRISLFIDPLMRFDFHLLYYQIEIIEFRRIFRSTVWGQCKNPLHQICNIKNSKDIFILTNKHICFNLIQRICAN